MSEPLPVEITIEGESFKRFIQSFEMDYSKRSDKRLTIELDTGEKLSLPADMIQPLLDAYSEGADE